MTNDDDSPRRRRDHTAPTVELDAKVLRKLVVSTVLDLGDDSGSVPVRVVAVEGEVAPAPAPVAAARDDDDAGSV